MAEEDNPEEGCRVLSGGGFSHVFELVVFSYRLAPGCARL